MHVEKVYKFQARYGHPISPLNSGAYFMVVVGLGKLKSPVWHWTASKFKFSQSLHTATALHYWAFMTLHEPNQGGLPNSQIHIKYPFEWKININEKFWCF